MRLNRNVKAILQANAEYHLERLTSGEELSLSELMRISHEQEQQLMQYVLAQPQAKFERLMKVLGPRWQEYTAMRVRNRARLKELCSDQGERVNGH